MIKNKHKTKARMVQADTNWTFMQLEDGSAYIIFKKPITKSQIQSTLKMCEMLQIPQDMLTFYPSKELVTIIKCAPLNDAMYKKWLRTLCPILLST